MTRPEGGLQAQPDGSLGAGTNTNVGMLLWGYFLIGLSFTLFVFGGYASICSSFVPETGTAYLDAVRSDEHYKYLVPLTVPVTLVAIIINWGSFKHWRHAAG